MRSSRFINDIKNNSVVTELLRHRRVYLFEYFASTDTMVVYDQELNVQRTIEQYLTTGHGYVLSEDRWQLKELLTRPDARAVGAAGRRRTASSSIWRWTPCPWRTPNRGACSPDTPRT